MFFHQPPPDIMRSSIRKAAFDSSTKISDIQLLTQNGLKEMLENLPRRAAFATFTAETTPRMRKTVDGRGTPYNEFHDEDGNCLVTKRSRVNVTINFNYGNSVNYQREREKGEDHEPFEPEPRKWGERVEGTPLVEHKGNFYLEAKVEHVLSTEYIGPNGNTIDREDLEDYLYSSGESSRQDIEDPVILRDYKLGSIRQISVNGGDFIVP